MSVWYSGSIPGILADNADPIAGKIIDGEEADKIERIMAATYHNVRRKEMTSIIEDVCDYDTDQTVHNTRDTPTVEAHTNCTDMKNMNEDVTAKVHSRYATINTDHISGTSMTNPQDYEQYCQPTSSKVLVEDMVTNDDDDMHFREYHSLEELQAPETPQRRFWDRLFVSEHMAWPGDARMPLEWNMMTSDIRGLGLLVGARTSTTHDDMDNAIPIESSNLDVLSNPKHWHDEYEDLLQGVLESMPPFCEVNHEIPLINMEK
ncbi:hypothetical protein EV421DRAFT_1742116 [Armillaria borealis]|uniref:Uncharacterized protein n=1 Tax=Armillaria borealis TaxID=47425 RepID=A0AA39IZK0_9AGAR|nr:hypothetical protein EV421DRAFT_1742116 [Armillaria borealis]